MNFDLPAILTAIEAASPDGRWAMLQRWMTDYPEIHELAYATPEEAFTAIRDRAAKEIEKRYNLPASIILNSLLTGAMKTRIESAIEVLQSCYQERNKSEKELSHGDQRRSTRVLRKKGTSTRAKRTNQNRD